MISVFFTLSVVMLNVFMLSVVMLIVMFLYCYTECHYAECPYDEFHYAGHPYAECHYAQYHNAECLVSCFYIVILSVVILNVCHSVIFPPTFLVKNLVETFSIKTATKKFFMKGLASRTKLAIKIKVATLLKRNIF